MNSCVIDNYFHLLIPFIRMFRITKKRKRHNVSRVKKEKNKKKKTQCLIAHTLSYNTFTDIKTSNRKLATNRKKRYISIMNSIALRRCD